MSDLVFILENVCVLFDVMNIKPVKMDPNQLLEQSTDHFYDFLARNKECPNIERHFVCPRANPCRCKGICSINDRKIGEPKPEKADFYINQIEEYRLHNLNLTTDLNNLRESQISELQLIKFKDCIFSKSKQS